MANIKPLGSWVLLRDYEDASMTPGGTLFLPKIQQNDDRPTLAGTVAAIGSAVSTVKVGDRVVVKWSQHLTYTPYETRVMSLFQDKVRLIKEHKILGVLE